MSSATQLEIFAELSCAIEFEILQTKA